MKTKYSQQPAKTVLKYYRQSVKNKNNIIKIKLEQQQLLVLSVVFQLLIKYRINQFKKQ